MRDIDAMLADHDRDHPDDPLAVATGHRHRSFAETKAERYGDTPRSTWPKHQTHWREADRAERAYWVTKLYKEDGLAITVVSKMLGLNDTTVRAVAVELGILRSDRRIGRGTPKAARKEARQAEVRRIFEERGGRVTGAEIGRMLGVAPSTVLSDLRTMGLESMSGGKGPTDLERTVARSVQQLADMGEFLLNHHELHLLAVSDERAAVLRKQLSRAVSGINRVRKYLNKGENQ